MQAHCEASIFALCIYDYTTGKSQKENEFEDYGYRLRALGLADRLVFG